MFGLDIASPDIYCLFGIYPTRPTQNKMKLVVTGSTE